MSKESKKNILKYFSSNALTSSQAIKKQKVSHKDDVVQNNEISLPSTSLELPEFISLDNTNNLVTTFEASNHYIEKQEIFIIYKYFYKNLNS